MPLWLVLGGSASGKSEFGERLIATFPGNENVQYIATLNLPPPGTHGDDCLEKINRHSKRRPPSWTLWTEPVHAAERILSLPALVPILWDGVGPVISMHDLDDAAWFDSWLAVLHRVAQRPGSTVVVSEEAGQGLMPESALSQRFVEALGAVNRQFARDAAGVAMVVAGLPLWIKRTDR